jgi:peptidoglycan/LPS O-acetylase OafA/YrhL
LTKTADQPTHLPQLDGLRGVAALAVVVSHAANAGLLPLVLGQGFGQMGVTLFYALSAFLLGHLYFRKDATTPALRRYAASRIARVLPLFYAVLALSLVAIAAFGTTPYDIDTLSEFARNALLIQGSSVLWSIPVELQFYLVFALLWWLASRRGLRFWPLMLATVAVQAAVAVPLYIFVPEAGDFNLAFWGHLFLAGLVLSQMSHVPLPRRLVTLQAIALIALVVFSLPQLRRDLGLSTLPSYADPLAVGVPLLLLFLTLRRAAPLDFLAHPVLRWLGGVSFGLYLLHMPVVTLVANLELAETAPLAAFMVVLGLSLLLAWMARQLVELPAQAWLRPRLAGGIRRAAPAEYL